MARANSVWIDEAALAWAVADVAAPVSRRSRRTALYARIGAGDQIGAIGDALLLMAEAGFSPPYELLLSMHGWLDGYVGTPDEPRLRRLLNFVASQPPPPPRSEPIAPGMPAKKQEVTNTPRPTRAAMGRSLDAAVLRGGS